MTLQEVADATNEDRELQAFRAAIRASKWHVDSVGKYHLFKNELAVGKDNVILSGSRILIQKSLQQQAVDIALESHQG